MPTIATSGPARKSIGADYQGSVPMKQSRMVALYERIQSDMVNARMQRDDVGLDTLSLLKSELVRASKEGSAGGRIDDELVLRGAREGGKRRGGATDLFRKAGRADPARPGGGERSGVRRHP